MVKQNKAKVSKSKWVFLLNVIASGMGVDSYWSASSSAITTGMAIRQVRWFLGKQAFSPLTACGVNGKRLEKIFLSVLCCRQDNWVFIYGKNTMWKTVLWQMYSLEHLHILDTLTGANSGLDLMKRGKGCCWFVIRPNLFIFSCVLIS